MPDKAITDLAALGVISSNDVFLGVDTSDTTMSPQGSNVQISMSTIYTYVQNSGQADFVGKTAFNTFSGTITSQISALNGTTGLLSSQIAVLNSQTGSWATSVALGNTGSNLQGQINTLSGLIGGGSSNSVQTTGNQNISGIKTFLNPLVGKSGISGSVFSGDGSQLNGVMNITGTQTIVGSKTFSQPPILASFYIGSVNNPVDYYNPDAQYPSLRVNGVLTRRGRFFNVADEATRFGGVSQINGDVLHQQDNNHYYLVVDDGQYSNSFGYYDLGSYAGAYVPSNITQPSTTNDEGTVSVGTIIDSTSNGTWTNSPDTYDVKWTRDGTDIGGSTGSTSYTTVCDDIGHVIKFVVTANNTAGSGTAESPGTSVVDSNPVNSASPTIGGVTNGTGTVTITDGSWDSCTSITYTYFWEIFLDGSSWFTGEHDTGASSYTTTSDEMGYYIRCTVTATNSVGSTPATSSPVQLTDAPVPTGSPEVTDDQTASDSGTVGDTLRKVIDATFSTASLSFTTSTQWYYNDNPLSGETGDAVSTSSYGAGIYYLIVTANNTYGSAQSQSNNAFIS